MSSEFQREETIFATALALPPDQRQAYLTDACGEDAGLREQIAALIGAYEQDTAFLDNPPFEVTATRAAIQTVSVTEKAGDRIGRYKLLQQIGEGGCGVVYMAEQVEPVRRQVALKIIKLGMDTKQVIARFEAERQALALMEHPNIARVLDAGSTETGRPYFVMELVRGTKITDFCDKNNLTTAERLGLFVKVCNAVQHAHQKGIIHRDLKPSNILVTLDDGVPLPKVIDFGIAKATQQRLTDKTLFTAFEQFIGTPAYMSPEQAEMNAQGVDTRSDIYSLGVLLYELLTGHTPFDAQDLLHAGIDEIRRIIREEEPERPSTRLSTMQAGDLTKTADLRQVDPPRLIHTVRGDLDWIVMKALEKDRNRRYETANGFARDIERYLADEPVTASPPGAIYRFRKAVRRHRFVFASSSAVLLALTIGLGISSYLFVREKRALKEAVAAKQAEQVGAAKTREVAEFLKKMLNGVGPSVALGRDTTLLREILDKTAGQVGDLTNQPMVEAELRTTIGGVYAALAAWPEAEAMQRRALELRQMSLGSNNLEVAGSLEDWGNTLNGAGSNDEAEAAFNRALALRQQLQGNENADVARCLNEIAVVAERLNRLDEAETADRRALAMQRKLLGNDSLEAAGTLTHLSYDLYYQGRPSEAVAVGREALAIARKKTGADDLLIVGMLDNLSISLEETGQLDEAEADQREALAIVKKIEGPEHPDLIGIMGDLSSILHKKGRNAEAESLDRDALAIARKPLSMNPPREIPMLGWALYHLAGALLAERKDLPEARALAEESLALYERHADWSLNEERHALGTLGGVEEALGETNDVEPLYRQHLDLARKGGDTRQICEMLFNLGEYFLEKHRLEESEVCFRELLELRRTITRSDLPYRMYDVRYLTDVLSAEKKYDQMETLLRTALGVARKYYQDQPNRNMAWLLMSLGATLDQEKKAAEARPLIAEAVDLYRTHPDWSETEQNYSMELYSRISIEVEDYPTAEMLCRQQLTMSRSDSNNTSVIQWIGDLATVLVREKKYPEAENLYRERLEMIHNLPGTNSVSINSNLKALANVLQKEGRTNESRGLLQQITTPK